MPSRELCGEARGQLHRGLGCRLPAPLPPGILPGILPSIPTRSQLPAISACSMPLQGHRHGSRRSPASPAVLPGTRTRRAEATPWHHRHGVVTPPCHGHRAVPRPPSPAPVTPPPGHLCSAAPVGAAWLVRLEGTAVPGTFMPTKSQRAAEQAGDGDEAALLRSLSQGAGTRHLCRDGNRLSGQAGGRSRPCTHLQMRPDGAEWLLRGKGRARRRARPCCTKWEVDATGCWGGRRVPRQGDSISAA